MTALKPIENRRVRGVASETYPVNEKCAHPECNEPATVHHIFPRSLIKSSSFFVAIEDDEGTEVIPHAVGLCGSGTTGHHGDVEEHRAWIKLEDGEFVWYDREPCTPVKCGECPGECQTRWEPVGPLNPQPGSREGKPKRRKKQGQERRERKTISLKIPQDAPEDLAGQYEDKLEQVETIYSGEAGTRSPIYTIIAAFDYVLLNEGS